MPGNRKKSWIFCLLWKGQCKQNIITQKEEKPIQSFWEIWMKTRIEELSISLSKYFLDNPISKIQPVIWTYLSVSYCPNFWELYLGNSLNILISKFQKNHC